MHLTEYIVNGFHDLQLFTSTSYLNVSLCMLVCAKVVAAFMRHVMGHVNGLTNGLELIDAGWSVFNANWLVACSMGHRFVLKTIDLE